MPYNETRFAYEMQRAAAHLLAPVMRVTGFRFSKASRDNRLLNAIVCRVSANILANGGKPGRMQFSEPVPGTRTKTELLHETIFVALAMLAALLLSLGISYAMVFGV